MIAQPLSFGPILRYWRVCWLVVGGLLLVPLLNSTAALVRVHPALPHASTPAAPVTSTTPLPPAAIPAITAALAANDAADYAPVSDMGGARSLRAANPAQRFAAIFAADGVRVAPQGGIPWTMRATTITTDAGNIPLADVAPVATAARVEYRRSGVTEWYANGSRGLEQGFTLAAPPAGTERFTLGLAVVDGAVTRANDGALLIGELRYGGLAVTDAAGKTLPAHLDATDDTIRIAVDATGAEWPVTVDPTLTQATLVASDPALSDLFGNGVAVATAGGVTTVVVGAPSKTIGANSYQGAAYVFTGNGGAYTQQARLTSSDGEYGDHFGFSVATVMDGTTTTIVVGTGCIINNGGRGANKAYVFTGSGATYTERATLTPSLPIPRCFGSSLAAVTDGTAATIAVGDPGSVFNNNYNGVTYLFAGSGASYPQQAVLANSPVTNDAYFGWSVALARSGATITLVVGAPGIDGVDRTNPGIGKTFVYTGSGANYTNTATLAGSDRAEYDIFGTSVAVAISGGTTAIAVGAPARGSSPPGKAYLYTGSGSLYTETRLTDYPAASPPHGRKNFGQSVGVVFAAGKPVVAVGDYGKQTNGTFAYDPGDEGVLIYRSIGGQYVAASLLEQGGYLYDRYGYSTAMLATGDDVTLVTGTPDAGTLYAQKGNVTVSQFNAQPVGTLQALVGATQTTAASPASTFNGDPFHLAARALDAFYAPSPPTGVTFTVNAVNGAGGVFNRSDPNSTTAHVTTQTTAPAGATPILSLYPTSTAGPFTVTATVDGTYPPVSATFHLTIATRVPTPTINANTAAPGPNRAVTAPTGNAAPGISPRILYQGEDDHPIVITGTGYTLQSTAHYHQPSNPTPDGTLPIAVYTDEHRVIVSFTPTVTAYLGPIEFWINNPPGSAGNDGGDSNHVTIQIVVYHYAPTGSTSSALGGTSILAVYGYPVVAGASVTNGGQPVAAPVTGSGQGLVGTNGGEIVAQGGGNLVSDIGSAIVGNDGHSLLSENGLGLITNDGGSIVAQGGGNIAPPGPSKSSTAATPISAPQSGPRSAPHRNSGSAINSDYTASTDANGVFLVAPVLSNGIPGTHTHTLALDGIAQPITYTITNLDPNDGHPATITSLSRTGASAGDPAFDLTITGAGFVAGSVISYGGVQLPTTFLSATQVRATIPATLLYYSGPMAVFVVNPDPNGGASLPATFTVTPKIRIAVLSPASAAMGAPQFALTVSGADFTNGSTVRWNGTDLATTFVSTTTLTATVPASLVAQAGTTQVTVVDPLGSATSALPFTVAVLTTLPQPQPGGPPVSGPSPLPAPRTPGSSTGTAPNPNPPARP